VDHLLIDDQLRRISRCSGWRCSTTTALRRNILLYIPYSYRTVSTACKEIRNTRCAPQCPDSETVDVAMRQRRSLVHRKTNVVNGMSAKTPPTPRSTNLPLKLSRTQPPVLARWHHLTLSAVSLNLYCISQSPECSVGGPRRRAQRVTHARTFFEVRIVPVSATPARLRRALTPKWMSFVCWRTPRRRARPAAAAAAWPTYRNRDAHHTHRSLQQSNIQTVCGTWVSDARRSRRQQSVSRPLARSVAIFSQITSPNITFSAGRPTGH